MIASAGFAVWAKKNQCHHDAANFASQRPNASEIGTPSITTRRVTRSGKSTATRCAA